MNMIHSEHVRLSLEDKKTRLNNNVLIVGGAGTGKSRFVMKPNLLQENCSFVITDPSGELLGSLGKEMKNQGYDVRVFNLVNMGFSNCYNPFCYIRDDAGVGGEEWRGAVLGKLRKGAFKRLYLLSERFCRQG